MKGKLFIISGQSGVGKNTILKALQKNHPDFHRAVTFTTRDPRPDEVPGEDHFFVYQEKFKEMIKNNELLEWAEVHGQLYGTPKEQIEKAIAAGCNVLMEIDVQGGLQIKKIIPETVLMFIKYEEGDLEKIIRSRIAHDPSRQNTTEEEILRRIATAKKEANFEKEYDYSVINPEGQPEQAIEQVENIIKKEIVI